MHITGRYNSGNRKGIRKKDIMNIDRKKPELLIPAGNLETLKIAVMYGADAIYIGGDMYGLRAKARNFSMEDMREGIAFAHKYGKKVYVTANITAHNEDLEGIRRYFRELVAFGENKPDALIISDPGVFTIAKEEAPDMELHISTQANNTNYASYRFWYNLGASRVVSARELSLDELAELRANIPQDMEIETFVHGAMCIAYSGRCLLSNYFTGRDANLGECTHSCRWKYHVVEEKRPGEFLPIEENERGSYIFNSKDLCMIEYIPELVKAGIDSLKVEGRMKTALYVATVAGSYRRAIDDYFNDPQLYEENKSIYLEEVSKGVNRQFTTGFFFGKPNHNDQIYDSNTYEKAYTYLGTISGVKDGFYNLEQKNKFSVGEIIEVIRPNSEAIEVKVERILDEKGQDMDSCPHPKQNIYVDLGIILYPYDILRRRELD
jgi:putative protease